MKKKVMLLVGILIASISLVGCDFKLPFSNPFASTKDKITDVTDEFMGYAKDAKADEMKKLVDNADSLKNYKPSVSEDKKGSSQEHMLEYFIRYQDECAKKMTYEIKDVNEDNKTVTLKCKYLDSKDFVQKYMQASVNAMLNPSAKANNKTEDSIKKAFEDAYGKATEGLKESFVESEVKIEFIEKDGKFIIKEISKDFNKALTANMGESLEKIYSGEVNNKKKDDKMVVQEKNKK